MIVGCDTGGTFTDFVAFWEGRFHFLKIPSTPADPGEALLTGLERLGLSRPEIIHGTTVCTNALLERKGGPLAFLTTEGFEDLIEIGRQNRPDLYALEVRRPAPLVPRSLRFGLRERTDHRGRVLQRLNPEELAPLAARLKERGVHTAAVCLLHSYANPANERAATRELRRLGFQVSVSHEVLRQFREVERASTTVVNGYLLPVIGRYGEGLSRHAPRLRIMQSSGGSLSLAGAKKLPVRTLFSGPAAGAVGAFAVARECGFKRVMTFDMGGTSTDVSLLAGEVEVFPQGEAGGLPVHVPQIPIHTVGAGGGSIAWVDPAGALQVGPQSAGADPGPACYGRGNDFTVTDAHLVRGELQPDLFLGGKIPLDAERARQAGRRLAARLKTTVAQLCEAVVALVRAHMERALRRASLQRGHDPADFVLVCFGGAGGLHALPLAEALGIRRVLVPRHPGLLSAYGCLIAPAKDDAVLPVHRPAVAVDWEQAVGTLRRRVKAAEKYGYKARFYADMRYAGQSFEIAVPLGQDPVRAFHRLHHRRYHFRDPKRQVEVVQLRVVSQQEKAPLPFDRSLPARGPAQPSFKRPVAFAAAPVPFYDRETLRWKHELKGPAVVYEYTSTLLIPPGWHVQVDKSRHMLATR